MDCIEALKAAIREVLAIEGSKAIDAVVFDMDGVLVDTELVNIEVMEDFFRERGAVVDRGVLFSIVGASGHVFWNTLREHSGVEMTARAIEETFREYVKARNLPYINYLNPGAAELLAHIEERGYKLALASSTEYEKVMRIMTQCGVADFFEVIVTGDMFLESKPDPKIYLMAAEKLGVAPARCLAVEDSGFGIESATRAGMTVVAKREERFGGDQSQAKYIVDDLIEIRDILEGIG